MSKLSKAIEAIKRDRCDGESDYAHGVNAACEKHVILLENLNMPWWRKDAYGWPIETNKGRPVSSIIRIVVQNVRKYCIAKRK